MTRSLFLLTVALSSLPSPAQDFRVRIDPQGGIAPTVTTPLYTLKGTPLGDLHLFAFGGLRLENNAILGGAGIERRWKFATNADLALGLGLEFAQGQKPKPAAFAGLVWRF